MSDTPSSVLTLIGTVHRDPEGYFRLKALLTKLRPTLLTLEMSPAALLYRQHRSEEMKQRLAGILERLGRELGCRRSHLNELPAVAEIHSLLALPFEYRAAADYADRAGISLALIDDSAVSTDKLKKVEKELITYENLRILVGLTSPPASKNKEGYRTAKTLIHGPPDPVLCGAFLQGKRGREGIGARDRSMAAEIQRRLRSSDPVHLVHIGGWVHLVADPFGETLFSRLSDLKPQRLLLE